MIAAATPAMVRILRDACVRAATSIDAERDPILAGWCVEVSLVARVCFGGDLLMGFVGVERHYWNRLDDGTELDLTSDQYGGDGRSPLTQGECVSVPDPAPIHTLVFAECVLEALSAETKRPLEATGTLPNGAR